MRKSSMADHLLGTFETAPVGNAILIVDDQPTNIAVLRQAVASLADVFYAVDGARALELARRLRPALIILDIEMPGMSGYQVLAALRADPALAECLVVFITGHERSQHELQALSAGGVDYLQKPLDLPVARARIANLYQLSVNARLLAESRRDMAELMAHLPAFVAYWDAEQRNTYSNDWAGAWFGTSAADMHGLSIEEVFGPPAAAVIVSHWAAVLRGEEASFDLALDADDAPGLFVHVALACRREREATAGILMLVTDISERRNAELALADERERLRVTLSSIGDAVIATDLLGNVTFCNPVAETMTGWMAHEALGLPIEQVMPLTIGASAVDARNPLRLALAECRTVGMALDCNVRRRDGRSFSVEDSAAPILDHLGRMCGAIIVFHDVSEARAMAVKMTHLANHDSLTNLPNRMLMRDRCEQAVAKVRRAGGRVALLSIDLDNFKSINATAGYGAGDALLCQVATRLEATLRGCDTLSREGGDEFLLLLTELSSADQVSEYCMRLHAVFGRPFMIGEHGYDLSASVGIALYPDDSSDVEQLYSHADSAMSRAKQDGRARSRFFARDVDDSMRSRVALQRALATALAQHQFGVYYQAKMDSSGRQVVGAEALVRWNQSDGAIVSPGEFIGLMEETGQILALGQQVMERACQDALGWQSPGRQVTVAVNVAAAQFADPEFPAMVATILARTGLAPALLELEITEGVMLGDHGEARLAMERLKSFGVKIAIDDFGTGFCSLTYLKRFPIDALKIDRSFVSDMLDDASDMAIVTAIVHMAKGLGLQLVAEGVESARQAEVLSALGCDVMQGFLYGRPAPRQEFERMLAASYA